MNFLLYILSIIFDCIIRLKNIFFDYKILKATSHPIPIICVGNLSMGGSGKTPHVIYLIKILKKKYNVAVLSRGYKRKSKGFQYVENKNTALEIGDEPLLIKQIYSDIIVAVEKNRNKGVKKIMHDFPKTDVIILDDGFQHRYINAGLNILLTSFYNPFFNDKIFPLGNLRENIKNKNRADIVLVTKCPKELNPIHKKEILQKLDLLKNQNSYLSNINYKKIFSLNNQSVLTNISSYSITLVTGVAEAKSIIAYLNNNNVTFTHIKFHDHHKYNINDVMKIISTYKQDDNSKKIILTTEKDAIKLNAFKHKLKSTDIYVLNIEIQIDDKKFTQQILDYVKENKRN
jgi:tetraacyldisaccharide 4'-kinase